MRLRALMASALLAALAAELVQLERRQASAAPAPEKFSIAEFIGGHEPALRYAADESQWQHVMCARQSAKSTTGDGILFDNAKKRPRSNNVLLGLKGTAVRRNNWAPIWKQHISSRYGIPKRCNNETGMLCTLDNGSRVIFAGTDDYEHVLTYLGNNLDGGVFIIDEAQDQKDSVLDPLLDKILPPMMSPTTRVILSGVIPDVPAGRFWRERRMVQRPGSEEYVPSGEGPYSLHNWGRAANVHTPLAMQQLAKFLLDRGLAVDDPLIQRDWFGRAIFDEAARAFRYVAARNGYHEIPADIRARLTSFAVGIDPGAFDRTAIVVVGWGEGTGLWVVEEWVTDRNADTMWSQIGAQLGRIQKAYRPGWYYADFGGSKMTLDVFGRDHGVPVVHAAKKSDRRGQVDRANDLFARGEAHVPIGSALEGDLVKTQWDKDARQRGLFEWSGHNHPDVGDAFRYAAHAYFEFGPKDEAPPEDKTPSVARRLKQLKDSNKTEDYFARRARELG